MQLSRRHVRQCSHMSKATPRTSTLFRTKYRAHGEERVERALGRSCKVSHAATSAKRLVRIKQAGPFLGSFQASHLPCIINTSELRQALSREHQGQKHDAPRESNNNKLYEAQGHLPASPGLVVPGSSFSFAICELILLFHSLIPPFFLLASRSLFLCRVVSILLGPGRGLSCCRFRTPS